MRECAYRDPHGVVRCTECRRDLDTCLCPDVNAIAQERLTGPDAILFNLIHGELAAARDKFPMPNKCLAALGEEVGELFQAMLQHEDGQQTPQQVLREAVQVASAAIRLATEGDMDFTYEFPHHEL